MLRVICTRTICMLAILGMMPACMISPVLAGIMLEKPQGQSRVINAGVGGNNTLNLLSRLDADVLARQPDLVIMMVGTNDILNSDNSVPLDEYERNLTQLIQRITSTGSKLAVMSILPCYEPYLLERHPAEFYGADGPNGCIIKANDVLRRVVAENHVPLVDVHSLFMSVGNIGSTAESLIRNVANSGARDGVHPTPAGYQQIANAITDVIRANEFSTQTVVCVGDSITYGVHVLGEGTVTGETYPAYLSQNLNTTPPIRVTTAKGDGADAYVHWYSSSTDQANQNNGGKTTLEVKHAGDVEGDHVYRKCYLRFDLSDIDKTNLAEVALELTTASNSTGQTFNVYGLLDSQPEENWIEGESAANLNVATDTDPANDAWLTWNNAPGNADGNGVDPSKAILLGTFTGGPISQKIGGTNQALLDFINADTDGLVTLIITRDTHDPNYYGTSHTFASGEHTDETLHPALLLKNSVPKVPGDANNDGKVDGSDVTILAGNWQYGVDMTSPNGTWKMGDFNGDGRIDGSDVTILAGNWQVGVNVAATAVPEPAMGFLLTSLSAGLIIVLMGAQP